MRGKRILLTGGSGDLGRSLIPHLLKQGAVVSSIDPVLMTMADVETIEGSILDRPTILKAVSAVDLVIHIAAWHGFHEFKGSKSNFDFWDLNMTGTFNLLQACVDSKTCKFLFISSTSIDEWPNIYGMTKLMGEDLCRAFAKRYKMTILSLRPRAFIPWWNKAVYGSFLEWANWFAKGAVHIDDVAQAAYLSCNFLFSQNGEFFDSLEIDGKHEFSEEELARWRSVGDDSILKERFNAYAKLEKHLQFAPKFPPSYKDNTKAGNLIGYKPTYGFEELIAELAKQ